jgi:hypothetical protein
MSDADAQSSKLDEVARLATALAEQMMASQIVGRSIPAEQLSALTSAARCLTDNHIPWPPLVQEIVHEIAERMESGRPTHEANT